MRLSCMSGSGDLPSTDHVTMTRPMISVARTVTAYLISAIPGVMALQRLRCAWTGTGVEGPGLTTFFAEADGTVAISVAATGLFDALKTYIPSGTTVFVPNGGDVIDELTGTLTGTWGT